MSSMSIQCGTGVIIQARTGSTRLPGKILLPFYENNTILDLIIQKIKTIFSSEKVVLATSSNIADDVLKNVADKHEIKFFRGHEENVLQRFIDASCAFGFARVLRICADNPLIRTEFIEDLIYSAGISQQMSYISHATSDGRPVIKAHFGLFCEYIKLDALKKVHESAHDLYDAEHVTRYIYSHPSQFQIQFLKIPTILNERNDLRFTIDTAADFKNIQKLYLRLMQHYGSHYSLENLVQEALNDEHLLSSMKKEIDKNGK